jgi:hypothetical protein
MDQAVAGAGQQHSGDEAGNRLAGTGGALFVDVVFDRRPAADVEGVLRALAAQQHRDTVAQRIARAEFVVVVLVRGGDVGHGDIGVGNVGDPALVAQVGALDAVAAQASDVQPARLLRAGDRRFDDVGADAVEGDPVLAGRVGLLVERHAHETAADLVQGGAAGRPWCGWGGWAAVFSDGGPAATAGR